MFLTSSTEKIYKLSMWFLLRKVPLTDSSRAWVHFLKSPNSPVCFCVSLSPIVVDVSGCHCITKVRPHLEKITNKSRLACNHTMVILDQFYFSISSSSLPPWRFTLHHPLHKITFLISQPSKLKGSYPFSRWGCVWVKAEGVSTVWPKANK